MYLRSKNRKSYRVLLVRDKKKRLNREMTVEPWVWLEFDEKELSRSSLDLKMRNMPHGSYYHFQDGTDTYKLYGQALAALERRIGNDLEIAEPGNRFGYNKTS